MRSETEEQVDRAPGCLFGVVCRGMLVVALAAACSGVTTGTRTKPSPKCRCPASDETQSKTFHSTSSADVLSVTPLADQRAPAKLGDSYLDYHLPVALTNMGESPLVVGYGRYGRHLEVQARTKAGEPVDLRCMNRKLGPIYFGYAEFVLLFQYESITPLVHLCLPAAGEYVARVVYDGSIDASGGADRYIEQSAEHVRFVGRVTSGPVTITVTEPSHDLPSNAGDQRNVQDSE